MSDRAMRFKGRDASRSGSKRGQVSVFDFIAAIVVFIVIFVVFITLSDRTVREAFLSSSFSRTAALGLIVSESFIGSAGVPLNWELDPAHAQSIGFALHQNYIDDTKLNAFIAMDYNTSKVKMGMSTDVDYHFVVMDRFNSTIYESGRVVNGTKTVLPFVRSAILNGDPVRLRLVFYD